MRNRLYDELPGRFLMRDRLRYVNGGNLFQYVMSAVVRNVDPTGLFASCTDCGNANAAPPQPIAGPGKNPLRLPWVLPPATSPNPADNIPVGCASRNPWSECDCFACCFAERDASFAVCDNILYKQCRQCNIDHDPIREPIENAQCKTPYLHERDACYSRILRGTVQCSRECRQYIYSTGTGNISIDCPSVIQQYPTPSYPNPPVRGC